MKTGITIEEALAILKKYVKTEYILAHSRESEVVMRALAKHFQEDEELWGICGLLHDLDLDVVGPDLSNHAQKTVEILKEEGYDLPVIFRAILCHAEKMGSIQEKRESKLEYSLSAAENITGIIIAYTLILPEKKLSNVQPKSVLKRLKEKSFAAKVDRVLIDDIEKTGLSKDKFVEIAVAAIKEIAPELGF
ncbi:MAG: hypothetical protein A2231_04500 [Candidatus Firestonebacteria bacterium RIFOXYA2_FULL_40_8]|nr:MAG: hypothetical protein A2231_04500 [Candidatus Firestonebacteria bacterium RIFOXYA2_FULL_40_8]